MKEGCRHRVIEVLDQKSAVLQVKSGVLSNLFRIVLRELVPRGFWFMALTFFGIGSTGYRNEGSGHPQFGP